MQEDHVSSPYAKHDRFVTRAHGDAGDVGPESVPDKIVKKKVEIRTDVA